MARIKHGLERHPLYGRWNQMMHRCSNPKHSAYSLYGARGITVCETWQNVVNFIADMGPSYREGLTIERIDNDKGYFPGNCYWAPQLHQVGNRRCTKKYTYNGETLSLGRWANKFGIPYKTLWSRVEALSWPIAKALETPLMGLVEACRYAQSKRRRQMLTYNGETKTISQWAQSLGMPYQIFKQRLLRGWPPERAMTTPYVRSGSRESNR